jgi:Xaa-Pro aminopeptidase
MTKEIYPSDATDKQLIDLYFEYFQDIISFCKTPYEINIMKEAVEQMGIVAKEQERRVQKKMHEEIIKEVAKAYGKKEGYNS